MIARMWYLVLLGSLYSFGGEPRWTSSDGVIQLKPPSGSDVNEVNPPPAPFLHLWQAEGGKLRFAIIKTEIPTGLELLRASVEKGFVDELAGKLVESEIVERDGYPVWKMAVERKVESTVIRFDQSIVRSKTHVYKVVAMSFGASAPMTAQIPNFVGSVQLADPSHVHISAAAESNPKTNAVAEAGSASGTPPAVTSEPAPEERSKPESFSQIVGGSALLLLLLLGAVALLKKMK